MFEHHKKALISRSEFISRQLRYTGFSLIVLIFSFKYIRGKIVCCLLCIVQRHIVPHICCSAFCTDLSSVFA